MGLFVGASVISIVEVLLTWLFVIFGFMGVRLTWLW